MRHRKRFPAGSYPSRESEIPCEPEAVQRPTARPWSTSKGIVGEFYHTTAREKKAPDMARCCSRGIQISHHKRHSWRNQIVNRRILSSSGSTNPSGSEKEDLERRTQSKASALGWFGAPSDYGTVGQIPCTRRFYRTRVEDLVRLWDSATMLSPVFRRDLCSGEDWPTIEFRVVFFEG